MKKKPTKTYLKKKLDTIFSKKIREVGFCHRCGATSQLQCAHIVSRSYLATRWNFDNAICLDAACHLFFTYHPLEFYDWIGVQFGEGYYEKLKQIALTHAKPNYDQILEYLNKK